MTEFPAIGRAERLDALEPPADDVRMVLDTDAYNEIDDQFAIAYALSAPGLDVEAVYAAPFHNQRSDGPGDGMEKSYAEIGRVLERLGREPAGGIHRGSTQYLPGGGEPVESPAAHDIVERARSGDGPLYVVAVGAPTNVASALLSAPDIVADVVVVWLGGNPHGWPTAREFNLRQDVHASRVLFDSGVPLVHVPCVNVAEHLRISLPELRAYLDAADDVGAYLTDITEEYFAEHGREAGVRSTVQWDVTTIAYLRDPALVETRVVHSPELSSELTWNRDPARHFLRVGWRIDRDGIWADFFATVGST